MDANSHEDVGSDCRPRKANAMARASQASVWAVWALSYWGGSTLLGSHGASPGARLAACLCCALALAASGSARLPARAARWWLAGAMCSLLSAALLFGANAALDALWGAERLKSHAAEALGGLELWFVLWPGVCSVCVAAALRAALTRRAPGARVTMHAHG